MSRFEKLGPFIWSFINTGGAQVIGFFAVLLVARIATPSDFGLIAICGSIVMMSNLFTDAGLPSILILDKEFSVEKASTILCIVVLLSIIMFFLIIACRNILADFFEQNQVSDLLPIMALCILGNGFGSVHSAILAKRLQFRKKTLISVVSVLTGAGIGTLTAFVYDPLFGLVLIFTLSSIFITIGLWAFAPWGFRFYCRPRLIYSNLTFSLNVSLSAFLNQGSKSLVTIFLNSRFGVADLGFYSRADSIMNLISQTLDKVLQRVSFPLISKENHGSHNEAFRLHIKISVAVLSIIVPLAYLIGSYPKAFVFILYGPKWEESVPILEKLIYIGISVPLISQNLTLFKSVGLAVIVTVNKTVALVLLCFLFFIIDIPDMESFLRTLIYYTLGLYLLSLVSLLSLGVKPLFSYIRYMVSAGLVLLGIIAFHRLVLSISIPNLYYDLLLNSVTFIGFMSVIYYILFFLFAQDEKR